MDSDYNGGTSGGSGPSPSSTVTGPDSFGASATAGTAATYSRGDHDHGLPANPAPSASSTVDGPDAFGSSSSAGSATTYSRGDHKHGLPQEALNKPTQFTPANTTGINTTTVEMLGYGATVTFKPSVTGNIKVNVTGVALGTAQNNATLQLRYGTGAAPANGTAATGTQIVGFTLINFPASGNLYFLQGIATGLTVGTTYWFDIAIGSAGTQTDTFNQTVWLVEETP